MKNLVLILLLVNALVGYGQEPSDGRRQTGATPSYHFKGGWVFYGFGSDKKDVYNRVDF